MSPHHHSSQSFALPPATKQASHLPCPLPPNQSVICLAPYHHITTSLHHHATTSPCHHVTASPHHRATTSPHHSITALVSHLPCPCHQASQSFAFPPATKPVSHLPCPLPPCHHITVSLHHRITASPHHRITTPPHHRITTSPRHHTTASLHHHSTTSQRHRITALVSHLPCPLPPSQSVICLAPCYQTSQSFALPPTTVSPRHCITMSPCHCVTVSLCHHITASPLHHVTTSPYHHISQSFALPPATKPVSHLPCPLLPNQSVICLAPYHCITASLCYRVTASPRHCLRFSPPHGYESDWLMLTSTVLIG